MKTVRLKLWLPVIVLTLTSILILGLFFYQTALQTVQLKQQKIAEVEQTMHFLQSIAEEALLYNHLSSFEQKIATLQTQAKIADLALISPQQTIQSAFHPAWKGQPVQKVLLDLTPALFQTLTNQSKFIIEVNSEPGVLKGYIPIRFPDKNLQPRTFSLGLLYLKYDLRPEISSIKSQILTQSILFWLCCVILMLIFMAILSHLVYRPILHLISVVQHFSTDKTSYSMLKGKGELAILGNCFNQLAVRLTETQTHLNKQKSLYALLSATNQIIIRINSQQQLFDEVCHNVIKQPHLVLAWIGLTNDNTKSVDVLAHAGPATNYLNCLSISTDPSVPEGKGPTATAIRENRSIVTNRFQENPLTATWHEFAKRENICASVVLPICKFQQVIGAFNIYADQIDYFSDDIIRLLNEMVCDISYALENLELEQRRQQAEQMLHDREKRLAVTLNSIGDAVIVTDTFGCITAMNPIAEAMTGWSFSQAENKKLSEVFMIIDTATRQTINNSVEQILKEGKTVKLTNYTTLISKQGAEFQIFDSAAPIRDENQQIIGVILVFQDITEQYAMYETLKISEERFKDVIAASGAYVWELDSQLCYTYLTKEAEQIKGYPISQLLNSHLADFIVPAQTVSVLQEIQAAIANKSNFELVFPNLGENGEVLWEEVKGQVVLNAQGEVVKLRGAGVSITQRKQAEAEIERLAYYDTLTCLPNRRMLAKCLADEIATAQQRHGKFGALLLLDLDHFKNLNDSLGHSIGDELLLQFAQRLKNQLRKEDFSARLGGDEFAILLPNLSDTLESAISKTRKAVEHILNVLREPYILKNYPYHSNCSIGITMFPQEQHNAAAILKQADTALYRVKANGRNTFQFYHPQMQETAYKRLEMEKNLRIAINEDQFLLYYQPQFNHLGKLIGAEVLLRWVHPTLGFIPPDQFIPVAEEAGLIVEIGNWIFTHVFEQLKNWQQAGLLKSNQHISINVSPKQFEQDNFFQVLADKIAVIGFNSHAVILELTEGAFLTDIDKTVEKMLQIRSLGFTFSIDDFGTGYSSLAYLKRLPLNELKIDKAFVDDIEYDHDDRAIVETIISMANHLRLTVIAEGVETQQQLEFLKNNGCLHYQGYFFSKPLGKEAFEDFLRQNNP
jgi:diguanylate cyclase (GGDEF)-like protein/PAS domain S-box-containing protein